jgi:hypothetical protein
MSGPDNETRLDMDAYIDAAASLVNLPVPPASKPIVREHLEVAARMAAMLADFELGVHEEPLPVYRPEAAR